MIQDREENDRREKETKEEERKETGTGMAGRNGEAYDLLKSRSFELNLLSTRIRNLFRGKKRGGVRFCRLMGQDRQAVRCSAVRVSLLTIALLLYDFFRGRPGERSVDSSAKPGEA